MSDGASGNKGSGISVDRRDFLKLSGAVAGSAALLYAAKKLSAGFDLNFLSLMPQSGYDVETLQPNWTYTYVPGICGICSSACDVITTVEKSPDGSYVRAIEIDGNPLSPLNRGKVCARGRSGAFLTYNKDRIKTPLIRTGPKGTWAFKEATWEEAVGYILNTMKQNNVQPYEIILGGGAIPCSNYRPQFIPFMFASQVPNMAGSPMQPCIYGEHLGINLTMGTFDIHGSDLMDDFTYSSLIVVWGDNGNPAGIFVNRAHRLGEGLDNGAFMIVIDPRQSEAASKADLWVPVKPGSDLTVAMYIINYIISNGYYDSDFVRYHTDLPFLLVDEGNGLLKPLAEEYPDGTVKAFYVYDEIRGGLAKVPPFTNTNMYDVDGNRIIPALSPQGATYNGQQVYTAFQKLAERVSGYTVDHASTVSGVDPSILEEVARRMATTRPMDIATGQKGQWGSYTTQFRKAVAAIMALTGNVDRRGAWVYSGVYRESMSALNDAYSSAVSSGTPPGILIQRPGILEQVPYVTLPGLILNAFATIYAFHNPGFWVHGYPSVEEILNQNLVSQGLKPAAAFSMFPDAGIYEALQGQLTWNGTTYKPKMAILCCVNPAKDFQESEWKEILSNLFVVSMDILPTDTTLYADVILPDATYLEREEPFWDDSAALDYYYRTRNQAVPRVFPQTVPNLDIILMMAYKMGILEQYVAQMAAGNGLPYDQLLSAVQSNLQKYMGYLQQYGAYPRTGGIIADSWRQVQSSIFAQVLNTTPDQVTSTLESQGVLPVKTYDDFSSANELIPYGMPAATPTGRIEVYSTLLYYYVVKTYGYDPTWDPLLTYVPPNWNAGYAVKPGTYVAPSAPYNDPSFEPTPPEFFLDYFKIPPIAYTYMTDNPMTYAITANGYHKNIYQYIWINPASAAQLGINEGDWIAVVSKLTGAKVVARAHLTNWIRPDTVGLPDPWGQSNPALSYSIRALDSFGNRGMTNLWTKSYDPLTAHRMMQQQTVEVRPATSSEVQEYTALASATTTLPSEEDIQPDTSPTGGEL
ncbi:MAG: molybdopterin-dependent oxidoreductase [Conexivisphaera sp.]